MAPSDTGCTSASLIAASGLPRRSRPRPCRRRAPAPAPASGKLLVTVSVAWML